MKILLIGYGKMGRTIENLALKNNHIIEKIIGTHNLPEIINSTADVAIEFSKPEAAFENVKLCLENNLPVVCGTTGWLEKKKEVEQLCLRKNGAFFYTSNYSIGVHIFLQLNTHLGTLMNSFPDYNVLVEEIHHTQKKDAPSGTAITIAEDIIKRLDRKKSWINRESEQTEQLVIHSFRKDPAPGIHVVKYFSPIDDIEIKHTAHSREGFASGALAIAEWIVNKNKKGLLSMEDYLKF
jgi:4-hydroxy-tetrahydrodipicolinate reductase